MFRKFIRTVFALAALIPLSWGIREITKSAIFDWIVQRLEGSLGLEEAEVIAFISIYAIPLAMSAITITFVLWLGVRWGRQATTTVGVPLAPNGNMPSEATKNVEPQIQIESQPTLRRHYEGEDRRRLGNIMYSLHELLNKGIFPAQLEVHEITSGFLYRVRNEGSQFIVDKLLELRGAFSAVRDELIRFIPGNGYY